MLRFRRFLPALLLIGAVGVLVGTADDLPTARFPAELKQTWMSETKLTIQVAEQKPVSEEYRTQLDTTWTPVPSDKDKSVVKLKLDRLRIDSAKLSFDSATPSKDTPLDKVLRPVLAAEYTFTTTGDKTTVAVKGLDKLTGAEKATLDRFLGAGLLGEVFRFGFPVLESEAGKTTPARKTTFDLPGLGKYAAETTYKNEGVKGDRIAYAIASVLKFTPAADKKDFPVASFEDLKLVGKVELDKDSKALVAAKIATPGNHKRKLKLTIDGKDVDVVVDTTYTATVAGMLAKPPAIEKDKDKDKKDAPPKDAPPRDKDKKDKDK